MRKRVASVLVAAATAAAAIGIAAPAQAADPALVLTVTYPLNGSTHIATTNSTMALGPGTLKADVDLLTGVLDNGSVSLPSATGQFKELGFIPVQATTEFIQTQPTTGTVDLNTGATTAESHMTIKLTDLKVAGLDMPIGDQCETETPAVIDLASQSGFDVLNGGVVAGTYTIPDFHNCLLATPIINLVIPGSGNSITLTLGAATF